MGAWNLTNGELEVFKADYQIWKKNPVVDEYGEEHNEFKKAGTIHCMWQPIQDASSIQLYGQDTETMKQSYLYETNGLEAFDQVEINGDRYEVISLKEFQNYTLCIVKRVIA